MTVINQNSISGITSITAASGSVQIFNSDGSSGSLTDLAGVNVSGVVTATRYRVSAGSTAAPAITPPDDTNTGIFFPSADTIAFGEGGTEVARFDSSGRLGVGLENPSVKVHISDSVTSVGSTGTEVLKIANTRVNTGSSAVALRFVNNEISGTNQYTRAQIAAEYDGTSNNNGRLMFATADTNGVLQERARIDGSGRFGIGTQSPVSALNVSVADGGNITISSTNDGHTSGLAFGDTSSNSSGRISYDHFTNAMRFDTNGSERVRLDSSGRLLVGTSSSASAGDSQYSRLQVQGNTFLATGNGILSLQRGQTATAFGVNNTIGSVLFSDNIGGEFARIDCQADAAPGTNDYPGRLVFSTTADGASSPTERLRITNIGDLTNKTSNIGSVSGTGFTLGASGYFVVTRSADCPVFINRETNDGNLIEFRQDGTTEGNINVSGTTVALAGAHLSRWSQLPSGVERTEILRGSVLSNIDEMCEWGDEENEQLNRMKVSDVEGDKNVSGVFQAWDDDDDTYINDFYCAMTGDFIIRIGAGVTVERGDLLMSAGDGTAKPQDDDIIRSKTIAKVTSTHVTCTYDDGSYCVPCVLMAC